MIAAAPRSAQLSVVSCPIWQRAAGTSKVPGANSSPCRCREVEEAAQPSQTSLPGHQPASAVPPNPLMQSGLTAEPPPSHCQHSLPSWQCSRQLLAASYRSSWWSQSSRLCRKWMWLLPAVWAVSFTGHAHRLPGTTVSKES